MNTTPLLLLAGVLLALYFYSFSSWSSVSQVEESGQSVSVQDGAAEKLYEIRGKRHELNEKLNKKVMPLIETYHESKSNYLRRVKALIADTGDSAYQVEGLKRSLAEILTYIQILESLAKKYQKQIFELELTIDSLGRKMQMSAIDIGEDRQLMAKLDGDIEVTNILISENIEDASSSVDQSAILAQIESLINE